jgi:hypothetical protein
MRTVPAALTVLLVAGAPAQDPPTLTWSRDLAAAQAAQKADGKPVLAYFTFET